jgi:hypothetical protein
VSLRAVKFIPAGALVTGAMVTAPERKGKVGMLHQTIDQLRGALDAARHDLAVCRQEFAAEVQRSQNLQHRLMQSSEAALQTINNLVDRLP